MSDLFGGLVKGLSSLMPQDDPNTQLFKLQAEVSDLKKQENDIYREIGLMAVEQYGLESFGELANRLKLTQANIAAAQGKLTSAQAEQEAKEKAAQEALAKRTCPECGHENPEGTKFCQECGTRMAALTPTAPKFCPECGHENKAGSRFCGGCGARLEG